MWSPRSSPLARHIEGQRAMSAFTSVFEHKKHEAPRGRNRPLRPLFRALRPYTDCCLPAVSATATTATATATALAAILCFVDVEDPSVEFCAVHGCNRGGYYCSVREGYETKPA